MKFKYIALACLVFFSGCSSEKTTDKTPVTIAQFGHVFLYMPLYIAEQKGFFDDEGLDVKFVSTGGDGKTYMAITSGSAQFGVSDPIFTAVAREKGQGGQVVASIVNGVPFWAVTMRNDISEFKTAEDAASLRLTTYPSPSTGYTITKTFLKNQGNPVDAQIIEGRFGALLPMIRNNQADVAITIEPMVSIALNEGGKVVYSMYDAYGDFALTGMTADDKFIQENPETVQAAVNAVARAQKYMREDFEGTVDVALKEFPDVDPVVVRLALKRMIDSGTTPKTPHLTESAWAASAKMRRELGDLKGDGNYAANVNMTFADKAVGK